MANVRKTISKNMKKNSKKNKENEKKVSSANDNIKNGFKIAFCILLCILGIVIISNIAKGDYTFIDKSDVSISTSEIIAGQTFNRQSGTYYVAFYNFSSTDENLDSTINELSISDNIYKVDFSNLFNKGIISGVSNKNANTLNDLKINGVTVIKIIDGKNVGYTEGYDNCVTYLKGIK